LQIYLNISSNGVNISTSTRRFRSVKFSIFAHKMKMQCISFGNDVSFSSSSVLMSDTIDNCLIVCYYQRLRFTDIVLKFGIL